MKKTDRLWAVSYTHLDVYKRQVKKTIRAGKYFSIRGALELMCSYIVEHPLRLFVTGCLSICPSCVFVPVPLHKRRFSERGFNQSEVIARCLSLQLKIPVRNDLVVRQRYTSSQAQLPKKEREQNLKGAFEYTGPSHAPGGVIIVDDVWTTGSTTREITRVLRLAGVKHVWVLTLAR